MMKKQKSVKYIYQDIRFRIIERSGHWNLDFFIDNKRQRRSTSLKANSDNLLIIKKEIIPELMLGLTGANIALEEEFDDPKDMTVEEFGIKSINANKPNIKSHVYERKMAAFKNYVVPYFGKTKISGIKPMDIQDWQNRLLTTLTPSSAQKYRSIFYNILQDAFINEIIVKNPMQLVKAPKQKSKQNTLFDEEEDVLPFNNAEIKLILEDKQLFEHNKNFYKLMLFTGMRPGEAVALRWQDILFDKKQIKIMQTRVAGKDGTPKTISSMRYVDILPQTLEVLQSQQKLTGDKEYLFYTRSGKRYFSHDTLAASFKRLLTRNKIKERVLYNLRHTFASQMISQGVDIVWVSKTLGHKDVSITLSTYTKFIQEDEATRFQKLEKFGTIFDTLANS
jgi:integrase